MYPNNVPAGMRIADLEPRPRWLDETLHGKGYTVGDLVTYNLSGYCDTNMVIYRITFDSPPNGDVVCTLTSAPDKRTLSRHLPKTYKKVWALPGRSTRLSDNKIKGYVLLEPVFTFFPGQFMPKNRTVAYRNVTLLRKLDIIELAKNFSAFQDFIRAESRHLSG